MIATRSRFFMAVWNLDRILPPLFDKVIPRLLRPLESNGRKILPSLVHGDLWYGNAGIIDEGTEEGIVYDPASFWAHNECMSSRPYHNMKQFIS